MSCEISAGRNVSCKDATGGVKGVYFLNFKEDLIADASAVAGTGNEFKIEKFSTSNDAGLDAYFYQLRREMASLEITVNSSPENGTTFFEQRLTINLNKVSQADADAIKMLAYGRPHIIVEDNQENLILLGALNGMDVTSGSISTGQAFGDRNGFTLEFTGRETDPFYTLVGVASPSGTVGDSPFEHFVATDINVAS